ncbi:unnamed protein product [Effrenium voratum]|nr:unnamed protein product [Effrenium voratum]
MFGTRRLRVGPARGADFRGTGDGFLQLSACRLARLGAAAAFAMPMTVGEAWRQLGIKPTSSKEQIKKAFKERIRQVHPDVTGDDGSMLRKVQDAFTVLEQLRDPTVYDSTAGDGLPHWATGLLEGITWSSDCPSYADFLEKPDCKALAVGEISQKTGIRPWAASWGKFSQQEANSDALRVCRQFGVKCRLIYVGSGTARVRTVGLDSNSAEEEKDWWRSRVLKNGQLPGFGWMPTIDHSKERLVGWKTITEGSEVIGEKRIRVPVFEPVTGGTPYLYAPGKPKQRVQLKRTPFKRVQSLQREVKRDKRSLLREHIMSMSQQKDGWVNTADLLRRKGKGEML